MNQLDQYFLLEWLSAWLILNWGAHLALTQTKKEAGSNIQATREWPTLNGQYTYILNAAVIAWLIQWSWQLVPPIE